MTILEFYCSKEMNSHSLSHLYYSIRLLQNWIENPSRVHSDSVYALSYFYACSARM